MNGYIYTKHNLTKHPLLRRVSCQGKRPSAERGRLFLERLFLLLLFLIPFTSVKAQVFIGCFSYDKALKSMPGYAIVESEMEQLHQAFEAELKRVEDDFNQKYEAFLDGRKDFPRTIMLKRQTELQQLLQQNISFKEKGRKELEQTRTEKLEPLHTLLKETVAEVARQHQLAVVINTDANACPYVDPDMTVDLNEELIQALTKKK